MANDYRYAIMRDGAHPQLGDRVEDMGREHWSILTIDESSGGEVVNVHWGYHSREEAWAYVEKELLRIQYEEGR